MKEYFVGPVDIYWIFYFIHVNILDASIWGNTYRNSTNYIQDKARNNNKMKILFVVICQYVSIYIGLWISIQCAEYIFEQQLATELQHLFIGKRDYPNTLSTDDYFTFVWQSICFQISDRFVSGLIITLSPVL